MFRLTRPALARLFGVASTRRPARPGPAGDRRRLGVEVLDERATPATFTVTSTADAGAGTLRQAITDANGTAGADDIVFALPAGPQVITLAAALPSIVQETRLLGPGANLLTVRRDPAAASFRVFDVTTTGTTPVLFKGLTITDGKTTADGGGIQAGGFLTLDGVVVSGNTASAAGDGDGGGIRINAGGFLRLVNSTVSGNTAAFNGGGVYFFSGGGLLVENSTVSGNTAAGDANAYGGGGVYFFGTVSAAPPAGFAAGKLVVRNSTFSGNTAKGSGGAFLGSVFTGELVVQNSTVTGNASQRGNAGAGGGGIAVIGGTGTVTVDSSIVTANTAAAAGPAIFSGKAVTVNFSAVDSTTGFTLTGANNLAPADSTPAALGLGPLADNGGPTKTHAITPTGKAADAGQNPAGLGTDQRGKGFFRTFGAKTDIGAFEFQPPGLPFPELTAADVTTAGATTYTFTVRYTDDTGVNAASVSANTVVRVTGPAGFNQLATFVSLDTPGNGTPRTATYKITPPGGAFDEFDIGRFAVSVEANQAKDVSGNVIPAGPIGGFNVFLANGRVLVSNTNDAGPGSLREGLDRANLNPTPDAVVFDPAVFGAAAKTITLATGELLITDSVTIPGPGPGLLTVSGNNASRVFSVVAPSKTVAISGLTISGGNVTATGPNVGGGGISVEKQGGTAATTLLLDRVDVSGNKAAGAGGGILIGSNGNLRLTNSTVSGNTAATGNGGGVYFYFNGGLLVQNSTISGNTAGSTLASNGGGGIYFYGTASAAVPPGFTAGKVVVQNSTISGNKASSSGGGIVLRRFASELLVQNSTITGNVANNAAAGQGGGGIGQVDDAATGTGKITVESSIIAGNTNAVGPAVFSGKAVTVNFSAVDSVAGFTLTGANNLAPADSTPAALGLGPLADNGGPTKTHAIGPTSKAKDAGQNPAGLITDQRGGASVRVFGPAADIGAYEFQPPGVTINQAANQADPTNATSILFTVAFTEPVTGFDKNDVTIGGTAGATTVAVTGSGANYTVAVSGMTTSGTVTASVPAGAATGALTLLPSVAGVSTDNSVTFDNVAPSATLSSAAPDPTNLPIPVVVSFTEPVAGFIATDVVVTNGAVANFVATSPTAFTFDVVPTGQGAVSVSVPAAAAADLAGNPSKASNALVRVFDSVAPTVTVDQAAGQPDPAQAGPILFTVVFGEPVSGFDKNDVVVGGTASPTGVTVTGSGTTYTVAVDVVFTQPGTVTVSVPAAAAIDAAGNKNLASTSTDNTVLFDPPLPRVTVNQAAGQGDPTNQGPVRFTVTFNEPVNGFDASDVVIGGTAGTTTVVVSGTGPTYTLEVSGMTQSGTVTASIPSGKVLSQSFGYPNVASTSTDNTITYDIVAPGVTLAAPATEPTRLTPIPVTVSFTEPVSGFDAGDLVLVNATAANFAGSGAAFTFDLVPTGQGLVSVSLPAGKYADPAGNAGTGSNTITRLFDSVVPTVGITQAAGQADPALIGPIRFSVVFSEPVTGFDANDVIVSGTAGATTATVTGSGANYTIEVPTSLQSGTVVVAIPAAAAADAAGNPSAAAVNTDNTVNFAPPIPVVTINQAAGQADPANQSPVRFTVVFDQPVLGFEPSDVVLGGTAGATTVNILGGGPTYTLEVTGMARTGTVTASIPFGKVQSANFGYPNFASTSTDNVAVYDIDPPTAKLATAVADLTSVSPIPVTLLFSEPVLGFDVSDLIVEGATLANFGGSDTVFTFTLTPNAQGPLSVRIAAGAVADPAGNSSPASNVLTRTFDSVSPTTALALAPGQANPTNQPTVRLAVRFTEPVVGFDATDVQLSGTAGAKNIVVTGSGTDYVIELSGMTQPGTVVVGLAAGAGTDPTGNLSTLVDPVTVNFDNVAPLLTIAQAPGQADPASAGPVRFLVTFSEPGVPLDPSRVSFAGSTVGGTLAAAVAPLNGTTYAVDVSGMVGSGVIVLDVPPGATADAAGNPNLPAVVADNAVAFDDVRAGVTIAPAAGQANPSNAQAFVFDVTFTKPVTGFTAADVVLGGTSRASNVSVAGSGANYTVTVTGMRRRGTVALSVPLGAGADSLGNPSLPAAAAPLTYSPVPGGRPVGEEVELTAFGTGAGGGPRVVAVGADGRTKFDFFAYAPNFRGGVNVATGDVNGDGVEDVVTGTGVGGGPHVKVFDGATGREIYSAFAYDPSFRGGVYVAVGDLNGDGIAEVITGTGVGGGPRVQVIDVVTGGVTKNFFAYDAAFRGGVYVSVADVNGDGVPEIVTGTGPGGGARVRAFDGETGKDRADFFVPGLAGNVGVFVAAGNFLGDGAAEFAVGPARGPGGVSILDAAGRPVQAVPVDTTAAPDGWRVGVGNRQADGTTALLVATGKGVPARVRQFTGPGLTQVTDLAAFDASFLGGVFIG